jgi:UDP-3-O-[3-hydroxymyristoyl] glucosamine N-acyltransferase
MIISSAAAVILVGAGMAEALRAAASVGPVIVRSDRPRRDFVTVMAALFASPSPAPGVHPSAFIDEQAVIGALVHIGPGCTIAAGSSIGDRTVLHPGVHLLSNVTLGADVIVHAGTVIGADGYGFERNDDGELVRFPHVGGVTVSDGAEIGANACIDRGSLEDTWIGPRARIDNLVHIAHNTRIGADAAIIASSMIGGSAVIGDRAWIAPSACIRDGITVGADAVVGLGAVVTTDVPEGATVVGNPARELAVSLAQQAALKALTASPPP